MLQRLFLMKGAFSHEKHQLYQKTVVLYHSAKNRRKYGILKITIGWLIMEKEEMRICYEYYFGR